MAKIAFTRRAAKALASFDRKQREHIRSKINQLAIDPAGLTPNIKGLRGRPGQRLRVGDFRVVFERRGDVMVILEIGHRRDIY